MKGKISTQMNAARIISFHLNQLFKIFVDHQEINYLGWNTAEDLADEVHGKGYLFLMIHALEPHLIQTDKILHDHITERCLRWLGHYLCYDYKNKHTPSAKPYDAWGKNDKDQYQDCEIFFIRDSAYIKYRSCGIRGRRMGWEAWQQIKRIGNASSFQSATLN